MKITLNLDDDEVATLEALAKGLHDLATNPDRLDEYTAATALLWKLHREVNCADITRGQAASLRKVRRDLRINLTNAGVRHA